MMTQTHGMTGIGAWMTADTLTRAAGLAHPYYVTLIGAVAALIAAKAPDIDTPDSRPGRQLNRLIPGAADTIEAVCGHRGLTHWASVGLCVGGAIGALAHMINPSLWWIGLAISVGWIVHIAGDCCTYQGVPAFGPFRFDAVRLPYGWRIECGGKTETRIIYPMSIVWAFSMSITSLAYVILH